MWNGNDNTTWIDEEFSTCALMFWIRVRTPELMAQSGALFNRCYSFFKKKYCLDLLNTVNCSCRSSSIVVFVYCKIFVVDLVILLIL